MRRVGPGQSRKVALLGGVKATLQYAPFDDPSWEVWSHTSVPPKLARRVDRFFDVHPRHCFEERMKCGRADYYGWLTSQTTPVYMQAKEKDVPASVRYPLERVQTEWPNLPFGSQTAYMIALALMEGVTHLGLFGIHYAFKTEYEEQRANCELWVGIAIGRGVQVVIPPGCPVAREPYELYGYESHTPEKYQQRKVRFAEAKAAQRPVFDATRLVAAPTSEQTARAERFAALTAAQ